LSKTAVLTIGTVVAVSASIAGDISQDLKSGYIIGATPKRQQASELFGAFTSAFFIALAVVTLGEVYGFGSRDLAAPQATLMKTVVDGVLQANLPWNLVLIGASFAIVSELLSVPSLPFAVGIYLPLSTMTPVFLGGVIKHFVELRRNKKTENIAEKQTDTGVLLSSGLIAGEGIMGVLIAGYAVWTASKPEGVTFGISGLMGDVVSFLVFAGLGFFIYQLSIRKRAD
jgi:putative OPT family oligopeptide transporter